MTFKTVMIKPTAVRSFRVQIRKVYHELMDVQVNEGIKVVMEDEVPKVIVENTDTSSQFFGMLEMYDMTRAVEMGFATAKKVD